MKERPILFKAEMVRAILDGRKTQTRRVVKPQPKCPRGGWHYVENCEHEWVFLPKYQNDIDGALVNHRCPHGIPGDRLWVRETWADTKTECRRHPISYRADWSIDDDSNRGFVWRPSIFMPRWASRITLEIVSVRVDRLQDITEEDASAEGFPSHTSVQTLTPARLDFAVLWDSINSKRGFSWGRNLWVWVIEFKKV